MDGLPSEGLPVFQYYLSRHIELDLHQHAPMAERLIEQLCGEDPARYIAADSAAVAALTARKSLWDGVVQEIENQPDVRCCPFVAL